jgi:site-specific DNA-methyltransferase (adenine-specific)
MSERATTWEVRQADCLEFARSLPDNAVDLTFGSPPYEAARTYGIDFKLRGQDWVDWMVERIAEFVRITNGLVAMVLEGQTRQYRWSAVPALLMADLHRRGIHLRKPPIYHRVGIPGSGGPDWLRNDWEWIICCTSGGRLPWSDNTSMGHPPKYKGIGGKLSHRTQAGERLGDSHGRSGRRVGGTVIRKDGTKYALEKANSGNVIHCKVGGGLIGSMLAHENEAPFPEKLAEFFVRSFCKPDGLVFDPFSGSGTTGKVAVQCGRRFIGTDIRESQIDLTTRRLQAVQRELF